MPRGKTGGFEAIASMPWPVGVALGIVAYIGMRYGVGWFLATSNNMFLSAIGKSANAGVTAIFAWSLLGICWAAAFASYIASRRRGRLLEAQTGLDSLRAMSWRQFETLVGEAFRRRGYRIEETGFGGADGGVDLVLRKDGKTTIVQCKQWRTRRVDVKIVREMYGLLGHHRADAVKIVAVGGYTSDARRFAQGKPIELVHGDALLALIRDVQTTTPVSSHAPPRPTTVTPATPACPSCGTPMMKRSNRRTHDTFWGCPRYPRCRGTRPA